MRNQRDIIALITSRAATPTDIGSWQHRAEGALPYWVYGA